MVGAATQINEYVPIYKYYGLSSYFKNKDIVCVNVA